MATSTPRETLETFYRAFNQGDVDTLLALYEPQGALVVRPDQIAEGTPALRQALEGFVALKPEMTMEGNKMLQVGDLALSFTRWKLRGTGPEGAPIQMEGTAAEVLRKQKDGKWLLVIDNPWGASLLAEPST